MDLVFLSVFVRLLGMVGDFASGANEDESVTPGKRFGSAGGIVFGKIGNSGCLRAEVVLS